MFDAAPTLAQSSSPSTSGALVWVGVLIVLVLLGVVAMGVMRRRLLDSDDATSSSAPLTLHDLRQAHARGNMTDEEFEAAKAVVLGLEKPAQNPRASGELRAKPGYDLTGAPLPSPESPPDSAPD